jgi:flagellar protein FlgJ
MSFLQTHAPQDALLRQLSPSGPSQHLPLRNPGLTALSTTAPFRALLLQQLLGDLDRSALTLDEAEVTAPNLPTRWDPLAALTGQGRQYASTASALKLLEAGPHKVQSRSRSAKSNGVTASFSKEPNPGPASTTPIPVKPMPPSRGAADGFLGKLAGLAQATAGALGLSPHLLLAQAALETGWGRKTIKAVTGKESFNLFGIKADKHWTGATVDVKTTEYSNGVPQLKVESFRAYDSFAESFADYAKLMKHRYGNAIAQGATAEGFGQALQAKGYATDPNYARKIARVAQSVAARLAALPNGVPDQV